MKLTGAQLIIKFLEYKKINIITGIPGGANLPLYNALYESNIKHILARHEQGSGFISHGMARSTGKPAITFATSGPGATNLITAIADAKIDSTPLLAFTGQVPTSLIGTDAFQEIDTYGMTLSITKHNYLVKNIEELPQILIDAFYICTHGRPGPVLIDIPKDIQNAKLKFNQWPKPTYNLENYKLHLKTIQQIADKINNAKKPMILAGGGIIHAEAAKELMAIATKNSIPILSTLMGLGSFPASNPLFMGMIGMHGAPYSNYLLNKTDLLIALGARFDDRATGKVEEFCPQAEIIHIDIDAAEINKIIQAHLCLTSHLQPALKMLFPHIEENSRNNWLAQTHKCKKEFPMPLPKTNDLFNPIHMIKSIDMLTPEDTIITTDVGQHQMWAAQHYGFEHPRTFLTSGGLGTMGFGLPAAIGAALINPDKKVICFTGDGSFFMNIQELATLAELNLNINIILFDNNHLGLVKQQQEMFYEKNYIASKFKNRTDFTAIAKGFGIKSINLLHEKDPFDSLTENLNFDGPSLIHIPIFAGENVFPIVKPGKSNSEMILKA